MKRNGTSSTTGLDRAVNNAQGKLKNSFLDNYPHHIVPGYNLSIHPNVDNYDEEHLLELFEEFPYDSNLPRPLLPPARLPQCVLKNVDPALQLLKVKSEHKDNIKRITDLHEKHRKDLTVCNKKDLRWEKKDKDTKITSVPRYVAELAELMDSDPDPRFKGEYNWYYTGGSLNHLSISDQNVLLFPYAEELVAVSIVEKPKSSWKTNFNSASKIKLKSTLFESRQAITSGSTCRILGRQKHTCNLYSLSEFQGRLELDEIHEQLSDLPYVSADLSPIDSNKYCTANGKRLVEIWDLNQINCLSSTSIPKARRLPDNWMTVKFDKSDINLVSIMDRCCLHCIDLRTPSDQPNLTLCPRNNLETCEGLSVNSQSEHNPFYQYLGSYHSLLLCDLRFANSCVVQKWTHLFKSPPLFCGIVARNNEEIITLSSQLSGESSIVLNAWTSDTQSHSYSLPRMPLTISETLRASQDAGKCLDPSMRTRLELCTAGTAVNLNNSYDATFFTQNSIGDIFYQCITHKNKLGHNSKINKESLRALDAWEVACLRQRKTLKPLVVSEKANMQHVVNAMRNVSLLAEAEDPEPKDGLPKWYQSVETMASYVDILAPELLAVWDVKPNTITSTVTPLQKVLSWLDTETPSQNLTQSQNSIQSQEINETNDEIYSQDLISVSQNIQTYTPDNSVTEQIVRDIPASDKIRKKVTKKRKKVAGF